jgi:Flp pilus assembly protein TadD
MFCVVGCSVHENASHNSAESMIRIAKKARKTGNSDAAVSFYNRALEIEPGNADAYLGLAESSIDANLQDAALEYVKKAESNGCDMGVSGYLRGKILLLSGNTEKAEKQFLKSSTIDALNALGAIYDEKGDHKKAQDLYKKIISKNPKYIDAYNNLGLSMLLTEKYKEAIFYLENACSLPEANVTYRSNLALAYGLSGNFDKARDIYAQDFEGAELENKMNYLNGLVMSERSMANKKK